MIFSNQSIGFKRGKVIKTYTFTKKEFREELVPPYAYDRKEEGDSVSFQCEFDSLGDPVFKKESKDSLDSLEKEKG